MRAFDTLKAAKPLGDLNVDPGLKDFLDKVFGDIEDHLEALEQRLGTMADQARVTPLAKVADASGGTISDTLSPIVDTNTKNAIASLAYRVNALLAVYGVAAKLRA